MPLINALRNVRFGEALDQAVGAVAGREYLGQSGNLDHVELGFSDQRRNALRHSARRVHRVVDHLQQRIAPAPVLHRVRCVAADQAHHARRMYLHIAELLGLVGQCVERRLSVVRVFEVLDQLLDLDLMRRKHVQKLQPVLLDGVGVQFFLGLAVDADQDATATVQPRLGQRLLQLELHLQALLGLFELFDLVLLGLPCAPLARRIERRDGDRLARDPVRAKRVLQLLARPYRRDVLRRSELVAPLHAQAAQEICERVEDVVHAALLLRCQCSWSLRTARSMLVALPTWTPSM